MIRTSLLVALLLAALPVSHAAAQTYKFKTIRYAKTYNTSTHAINAAGTIVGGYYDFGAAVRNCFLLTGGTKKSTLSNPNGSMGTECWDINSAGTVVGDYVDASGVFHGYVYKSGAYTTIDPPGTTKTVVYGINDSDVMVGYYLDASGNQNGFMYDGTTYTTINVKGGNTNQLFGINASGQYTISATLSDGNSHSYLVTGKNKMELVFPNIVQVAAHHLNTAGQVCATLIDANSDYYGGVYDPVKNAYYQIKTPKVWTTIMDGINDSQTLVGRHSAGTAGTSYGYVATGSLP